METNTTTQTPKLDRCAAKAKKNLLPLIKYAAKNKGTMTIVADRLSKLTGKKIVRQMVERWLNEDDNKRDEPRLGIGLYLIEVQTEICHGGIPD